MDEERFVHILDREIPFEELRVDEKKNLKSYVKVLGAFKESCCYRPSDDLKKRTVSKIRKLRNKPYRMLGTVAACLALGFFSVSFFTGNTILIKKKGDLYQLANVLGSSSTLSEKLRVNLTAFPQEETERNDVAMMEQEMERSLGFLSQPDDKNYFEISGINTTY
ncbi:MULTISPECIES: hypothetical protein [unclassified Mesotoga]|uniref:hypothetical protein n=1 Tax=unclassified Mesotoga TaxID=1184398 RepID=UPI000DA682DC|nr:MULTISPECIES: hypothetical protein [unclassified Mesotoga]PZC52247.1 hypothetical protein LH53_05985 [Mesotoga sp. TolDC]